MPNLDDGPSIEARRMQVVIALQKVSNAILAPFGSLAYRANIQVELKGFLVSLDGLDVPGQDDGTSIEARRMQVSIACNAILPPFGRQVSE